MGLLMECYQQMLPHTCLCAFTCMHKQYRTRV